MEKVWEELKKIEAQAGQIRAEAAESAKQITTAAEQAAEKLKANSKTYAQEEAQQLHDATIDQANRNRKEMLKQSQADTEKLRQHAEKRMEKATEAIVKTVIGANNVDADSEIR
jgi:vacuolar-type H+-ATPase subunit H